LQNKAGIAVVTSNKRKPFLTEKAFYTKKGFETVDSAAPYFELMVLKLQKAPLPRFSPEAKTAKISGQHNITIIFSNQWPFMEAYVAEMAQVAKDAGFSVRVQKLESCQQAQETGSPFGTLGIYYRGEFLTHELMSMEKFRKIIGAWWLNTTPKKRMMRDQLKKIGDKKRNRTRLSQIPTRLVSDPSNDSEKDYIKYGINPWYYWVYAVFRFHFVACLSLKSAKRYLKILVET